MTQNTTSHISTSGEGKMVRVLFVGGLRCSSRGSEGNKLMSCIKPAEEILPESKHRCANASASRGI